MRLFHVHPLEHTASGAEKRETRESHLGFSCLHSEVTEVTPPTFHCPEWVTEDWKHSCFVSITVYRHPSVELLRAVLSGFLTLEKLLRYGFVQRLNVILPSPSGTWRHFLFSSFGLCVSDSLLHLSLCQVGLVRFVSPLSPTSLLHSVSLTAGWFSAFAHEFTSLVSQYLLSSFYVFLLDLKETLKNKTQYLLSRSLHFGHHIVYTRKFI